MLEVDRSLRHNEAPTEINATMDNALPASAAERHGFEYYRHGTLSASVSTPEQIKKTTLMHALADNLGARGADGLKRKWHAAVSVQLARQQDDVVTLNTHRRSRTFEAVAVPTSLEDRIGFSKLPHEVETAPKKVAYFGSLSFQ